MASKDELACVYAALILHDAKLDITAHAISTILEAAHIKVAHYIPALFANMLAHKNLEDIIFAGGAVAAAPVAVAPAAASSSAPAEEEKKEDKKKEEEKKKKEEEEEEEMDMGGLFDFCLFLFVVFVAYSLSLTSSRLTIFRNAPYTLIFQSHPFTFHFPSSHAIKSS